ncbi:MAG: OmpA family protein [Bacteroidales bacterium]|jgi:peptidoglycan-associated lipoprotein|nr:OmpA family protein [Bacteroidales bacterium]
MKRIRNIITFLVISFICVASFAQKQSLTQKADEAFYAKQYTIAVDLYKKAYADVSLNRQERDRILFCEAECYRFIDEREQAIKTYKRLVKAKYYNTQPKIFLHLADLERFNAQWDDAEYNYKEYLKLVPNDELAQRRLASINKAKQWMKNPTKHEIINQKELNTQWNDWSPKFLNDETEDKITFTSSRPSKEDAQNDVWTGEYLSNIYSSQKLKNGELGEGILFSVPDINSDDANDGEMVYVKIGKVDNYYFSRCKIYKNKELLCAIYSKPIEDKKSKNKNKNNKARNQKGGKEESTDGGSFVMLNLGDTSYNYLHPAISSDELTLYFSSDRPGGMGDYDIWKATRQSINEPFGNITNLGKQINTEGKEQFPTLRSDTRLYYSSDGLIGLGGYDIFYSDYQDGEWTEPTNLGYPINTQYDEIGIVFNKIEGEDSPSKAESGYFSSNREGGVGGDDIYSFYRAPLLFTIKGRVHNEESMQPIEGAKIKLSGSDKTNIETLTDKNGDYAFNNEQVKYNVLYTLQASQVDYINGEEKTESTIGLTTSKDFVRDFKLMPVTKAPIMLPEIRYDLGKWDLKDQYIDSLSDLMVVLLNNPSFVVELRSHTDIRPFPKITNDTLSQRRAESVVDFLFSRGVERARLIPKGYGDRIPRTLTSDTESEFNGKTYIFPKGVTLDEKYIKSLKTKGEQEAAHQLNRRSEFRIVRTDYISPEKLDSLEDAATKRPIIDMVKGTKPLPITTVPIIYTDNNIKLTMINGEKALVYIVLNGANVPAIYNERYKDAAVLDWDVAMAFLLTGRITKDDFKDKEKAFDKDGNILDESILIFKNASIGKHTADKYEVLVKKGMSEKMIVNKNGILNFGRFRFDKANGELIFE